MKFNMSQLCRTLLWAMALGLCAWAPVVALAAGANLLTYPADSTVTDTDGSKALTALRADPGNAAVTVIAADDNAVYNNLITVTLPSGQKRTYTKNGAGLTPSGSVTWGGSASTMQSLTLVAQGGR
jgi:YD repeat-containing protein